MARYCPRITKIEFLKINHEGSFKKFSKQKVNFHSYLGYSPLGYSTCSQLLALEQYCRLAPNGGHNRLFVVVSLMTLSLQNQNEMSASWIQLFPRTEFVQHLVFQDLNKMKIFVFRRSRVGVLWLTRKKNKIQIFSLYYRNKHHYF